MDAPTLLDLRRKIDAIDGKVHELIRDRAALVGSISAAKPAGGLALRPGREAQIMRARLAAHDGAFPLTAVYRMWREMMSAFTLM
ncbi:MAG: chorismate mutase, partial [Alphaproteobacteria bacterium]|nr:chorismate mutase [Alphaproteobacteria bacterium]